MAVILGIRVPAFLCGWWLMTRYADWRQVAGYPILLISALPDALWVRYAVDPKSANWPLAMTASLVASSALTAALLARAGKH